MQFVQLQPQNSVDIPSSSAGTLNLFVDAANDKLIFKDSYGVTSSVVSSGSGGSGAGFPFTGSAEITGSLVLVGSLFQGGITSKLSSSFSFGAGRIPYVNYGTTGLDQVWNSQTDDSYFEVALPFSYSFSGSDYNSVFFSANQYFTFGAGSNQYDPINSSEPQIPGYHIAATDTFTYELWTGSLDSGNTFQIYVVASDNYNNPNQNRAYTVKFTSGSSIIEVHVEKMSIGKNYLPDSSGVVSGIAGEDYLIDLSSYIYDGSEYAFATSTYEENYPKYYNTVVDDLTVVGKIYALDIDGISIKTAGTTIYSENPKAGPDFNQDSSIFLGSGSGYQATNAINSNFLGYKAGYSASNADNSNFLGVFAGYEATYAQQSNFLGNSAGYLATDGHQSNFLGNYAGYYATNAYYSNFLGYQAGREATNAWRSNFFGASAGYGATNAHYSNFIGEESGIEAINADHSNFLGNIAGQYAINAHDSNFLGYGAGYLATNANNSNFVGRNAGSQATNAIGSQFLGFYTGYQAYSASNSNFLGGGAGYQATNANNSNFLGSGAGGNATNANDSNFLGYGAGNSATNADNSNFLGYWAGFTAYSASYSNFLGYWAGYYATNADNSNFLGYYAGYNAYSASYSNFLGYWAGREATYAINSNFLGYYAGFFATDANNSNFLGYYAGYNATSANNSFLAGYQVGYNYNNVSSIGPNNIVIGTNITLDAGRANSINIGGLIFGTGSYSTTTGNPFAGSANGKIGINQPNPQYSLDVSGSIGLTDLLVLASKATLPTANVPSGSLMASGSGVDFKPYFWNGSTWTALF